MFSFILKKVLLIGISLGLMIKFNYSNSPQELIEKSAREYVEAYLKPLVTGVGTAVGGGLYHTAKTHHELGVDIGLKSILVPVPKEATTCQVAVPGKDEKVKVSTIVGPSEEVSSQGVLFPGGLNLPVIPLLVPQASVGLIGGWEVMGRFMNFSLKGSKITFWGLAGKYEISKLIPLCPINFSAQIAFQGLNLAEILRWKITSFNLHLSKDLIFFTPYLGLGVEKTVAHLSYTYRPEEGSPEEIALSIEGENNFRAVVGIALNLFLFRITADYNLGKYSSFCLGVCFSFR
jgi:hypothetical protein